MLADGYGLTQQLVPESQQLDRRQCLDAAVLRKTVSALISELICEL